MTLSLFKVNSTWCYKLTINLISFNLFCLAVISMIRGYFVEKNDKANILAVLAADPINRVRNGFFVS